MHRPVKRVRFGRIHAHDVTFQGALDAIAGLVRARAGGYVVTPNVDHVVLADGDDALKRAYDDASLSLVDGKPLVWLSQLMGHALPAKISGSDLVDPLMGLAAKEGFRVAFLGGREGVGARAREVLAARHAGLQVVLVLSPPLGFEKDAAQTQEVLSAIRAARADLLLVALGAPKQELWMQRHRADVAPAVCLGIGATLDFIAGEVKRAPRWMSEAGLEWVFRISQDPARMAHRYLVRDRAFFGIAVRTLRLPKDERASTDP